MLDLPEEAAADCLTEGGDDFGVDAMHVSGLDDGEFAVTVVQGKYKRNLDAANGFPQGGVEKALRAIRYLFNPDEELAKTSGEPN